MKSANSSAPSPRVILLARRLLRLLWDRNAKPPKMDSSPEKPLTLQEVEAHRRELDKIKPQPLSLKRRQQLAALKKAAAEQARQRKS